MTNDINLDTPRTGTPSEEYKAGWDRIFGKKQEEEPKIDGHPLWSGLPKPEPRLCGACGVDLNKGMCRGCREVLEGIPKHDVKKTTGDW